MAASHGLRRRPQITVPLTPPEIERLDRAHADHRQIGESRAGFVRRLLREALDALGVEQ